MQIHCEKYFIFLEKLLYKRKPKILLSYLEEVSTMRTDKTNIIL